MKDGNDILIEIQAPIYNAVLQISLQFTGPQIMIVHNVKEHLIARENSKNQKMWKHHTRYFDQGQ